MRWTPKEEGRVWHYLLREIECLAPVFMIPVTTECFSNYRIIRLFETLRLFVEAGQVPLNHRLHPHVGLALRGGLKVVKI